MVVKEGREFVCYKSPIILERERRKRGLVWGHTKLILGLHWYPTYVLACVPAAALAIQLPAYGLGKHWSMAQVLRPLDLHV